MNFGIIIYLKNGQTHNIEIPNDLKMKADETAIKYVKRLNKHMAEKLESGKAIEFKIGNGTLVFKSESIDGYYVGEVLVSKEK